MKHKREYFPSDALRIINKSEGFLVRNRQRMTAHAAGEPERRSAHAIGRHLLSGSPGSRGLGVGMVDFKDRFLANPTYDDGSSRFSSAWLGKGDMAVLLCEALNSQIGQAALGALDLGVTRVAVHYLNAGKLAGLFGGMAGSVQMQVSEIMVTPQRTVLEWREFHNKKGEVIRKELPRRIPASKSASVSSEGIAAVHLVLDAFKGGIHLQTLFPGHQIIPSTAEWSIGRVNILALAGKGGNIEHHMSPCG